MSKKDMDDKPSITGSFFTYPKIDWERLRVENAYSNNKEFAQNMTNFYKECGEDLYNLIDKYSNLVNDLKMFESQNVLDLRYVK